MKRFIALALCGAVLAACGDDNGTGPSGNPVGSISIAPDSARTGATVLKGDSLALAVTLLGAQGDTLSPSGRQISYTSSDEAVATVSGTGMIRAVAAGTATITVTSEGKSADAKITVPWTLAQVNGQNLPATVPIPGGDSLVVTGGTLALHADGRYRAVVDIDGSAPSVDTGSYVRNGSQITFTSDTPGVTMGTAEQTSSALTLTIPGPPETILVYSP
ncbi:MAG TPA: Ig-like domain-containing protein [Gemmatimonadaceae bacterium]|nr:Ig-like domain-containing protein [Gemmatimonadaceae bacterium]